MGMPKKKAKEGFRKKPRFLPQEQRRKDILEAARQVFAEKGFHKSKIEDIAALAGIGHGTVYCYYPSKASLATDIIGTQGASGFLESLKMTKTIPHAGPTDLLEKVSRKYYGNLKERLPLMRFRIAEAVSNPDLGRNYYNTLLHRLCTELQRIVGEYQKKGVFKQGDPFIFGQAFYGMLFGFLYCQELMLGKDLTRIRLQEIIPQIVDIFLHGVSAPSMKKSKNSNRSIPKGKVNNTVEAEEHRHTVNRRFK